MVTSIRHLCYLLFSTYLLTIIKLLQLSLIMIIWWHSLGALWIPPSTSKSGIQIRDYRASFYYRWPALKQWASSFFEDLKLFYSSTNKQRTWLSLITTYAMRENSLYSEIPFFLGWNFKISSRHHMSFCRTALNADFRVSPQEHPTEGWPTARHWMPQGETHPSHQPCPLCPKHSRKLPLKSCISFLDCDPAMTMATQLGTAIDGQTSSP